MKNQKIKKVDGKHASITVEAAFVFPIFFFTLLIFIYFFQLMLIQAEVQKALFDMASFSSQYAYFTKVFSKEEDFQKKSYGYQGTLSEFSESILNQSLIKIKFLSIINKKFLNKSCIKNGAMGISFSKSKFMENENDIDIIAVYKIRVPSLIIKLPEYTIIQQAKTKAFFGKSMLDSENKDNKYNDKDKIVIVYITESGKVYHVSRDCTYLNPSIKKIWFKDLDKERNNGGHKYSLCGSCCKKAESYQQGYITTWGDGFHSRLDCSGLKRTIREEKLQEAEEKGYHVCSKCKYDQD